jgi:hypothetical protein
MSEIPWQKHLQQGPPTALCGVDRSPSSVMRSRIEGIEQGMIQDQRFYGFTWRLKYQQSGPRRYKEIQRFWQQVYETEQPHNLELTLRSFLLNDLLEASDELYALEHPMRPPSTSSWGFPWVRRSSAGTGGSLSPGSSKVGTESVPGSGLTRLCVVRGHPLKT